MKTIKLQLLLTKEGAANHRLAQAFQRHRIKLTERGNVTVSGEISENDFVALFAQPPPTTDGGLGPLSNLELPVPQDIAPLVTQITLPPRHELMK